MKRRRSERLTPTSSASTSRPASTSPVAAKIKIKSKESESEIQRMYRNMFLVDRGPNKRRVKPKQFEAWLESEQTDSNAAGHGEEDTMDAFIANDGQEEREDDVDMQDGTTEEDSSLGSASDGSDRSSGQSDSDNSESEGDDEEDEDDEEEIDDLIPRRKPKPSTKTSTASEASAVADFSSFDERWRIWKEKQPEYCSVCLEDFVEPDDAMVYCDSLDCDVCVHQKCYGITQLPRKEDPWYCDRCLAREKAFAQCIFCPNPNGALKKLKGKDMYVHVVCVLWFKAVAVADMQHFEADWSRLESRHWTSECCLCANEVDARMGVCVSCDAGGCKRLFHATCGHRFDLLECDDNEDLDDPHFVFCKKHCSQPEPRLHRWARWSEEGQRIRKDFDAALLHRLQMESATFADSRPDKADRKNNSDDAEIQDLAQLEFEFHKRDLAASHVQSQRNIVRYTSLNACYQDSIDKLTADTAQLETKLTASQVEQDRIQSDLDATRMHLSHLRHSRPDLPDLLRKKCHAQADDPIDFFLHLNNTWRSLSKKHAGLPVCRVCKRFERTPGADTVADMMLTCYGCTRMYHAGCLDPPVVQAPSKGFAWQCLECDSKRSTPVGSIEGDSIERRRSKRHQLDKGVRRSGRRVSKSKRGMDGREDGSE